MLVVSFEPHCHHPTATYNASFRRITCLQKFASGHAHHQNHFSLNPTSSTIKPREALLGSTGRVVKRRRSHAPASTSAPVRDKLRSD